MRIFSVFILVSSVLGCVAYPSRNVVEPIVDGKISDYLVVKVSIVFGSTDTNSCKESSYYFPIHGDGEFYIPAKYSWIKTVLVVPAEGSMPFVVCAYTNKGEILSKSMPGKYVPNGFEPSTIFIHCYKENEIFECK